MKTTTLFKVLLIVVGFHTGTAQDLQEFFSRSNDFFNRNVVSGRVDYQNIKADSAELDEILDLAEKLSVSKDDPKNYQAFWINGYNLHVIKGIVNNYPVKSPLDINGFFDKTKRNIGGKQITLNDIENKLLRANFSQEVRFHFVLVCAGLGCPPIIDEAYLPNKLDSQLQLQTELALNNPNFIQVKGKKVLLSQIFEWYKDDFTQNGKSEIDYINQFREEKLDTNLKTGYYSYDWSLNETK